METVYSDKPRIWQPIPSRVTLWRGCDSGGVLPRHAHEEFQIVLSEMPYTFSYRRSNTILPPRHLGVIQSGEPHASRSDDSTGRTLRLMFFSPEILLTIAETLKGYSESPVLPNLVTSDTLLVEQFLHIHTTLEGNSSQLECESLVFEFLTQLILRCAENPPNLQELQEPAIVKQIREYLEDNYAENVSLTQLAQIVERTPAHLVRVFSAEVGLPPHAYQIQVKIARAKTLLMKGRAVADVAQATGFADQAHFSRQFKRLNGVTPMTYRRHIKNVQDLLD